MREPGNWFTEVNLPGLRARWGREIWGRQWKLSGTQGLTATFLTVLSHGLSGQVFGNAKDSSSPNIQWAALSPQLPLTMVDSEQLK